MSFISKFLARYTKLGNTTRRIDLAEFRKTKYDLDWPLLVRMFDMRMWLLQNSKSNSRRFNTLHEIEGLHNDLNYLWARRSLSD